MRRALGLLEVVAVAAMSSACVAAIVKVAQGEDLQAACDRAPREPEKTVMVGTGCIT